MLSLDACSLNIKKLFSIRILLSIIHEQLTEFTCDLLHTVYKYSPYVCLSIFLSMMHNRNLYEDFSTSKDVNI